MAIFSSNSISIGLALNSKSVLSVRLDQERGILLNKKEIPAEALVLGNIINDNSVAETMATAILETKGDASKDSKESKLLSKKKGIFRFRKKSKGDKDTIGAAICIPSEAVFTSLLSVPLVVGKDLGVEVEERIEKIIPVKPEDIVYLWKQLGKTDEEIHVAIAAMDRRVLNQYRILCEKQHLRVASMSIPSSIIWLSAAPKQKETALLFVRFKDDYSISSLMYHSWPIDELVLPSEIDMKEQIERTKQMLQEQRDVNGIVPKRIVFVGSDEEMKQLQDSGEFSIPIEKSAFAVPERIVGYELGLFSILGSRKDKLLNMLSAERLEQ